MAIHNKIRAYFLDESGVRTSLRPITYDVILRTYLAKHSPMLYDEQDDTVAFFRQNRGRSITLTVRHRNTTDSKKHIRKLRIAWLLSHLPFLGRPTIFFEKNSSRYEESSRAVYEYILDNNAESSQIAFIVPSALLNDPEIDQRYKSNMIAAHSFKHYLAFFRSRSFIGTEAMSHALELRCQSLLVQNKLLEKANRYVFLQHGVMYMVSLDSPQRTSFRRESMPPQSHVVVSSEKEGKHFIDLAGFSQDDLIVSGLPKFDKSKQSQNADKIVIMPTWRIWEFNQVRSDPKSSGYYKMIKRILDAIPEHLKNKVIVCPHPLFSRVTFGNHFESEEPQKTIGEILSEARVFITDYSSAAFDAFYRGSSVIFYWEELEECMAHYGEPTHLMLTESDAFGQIAYSPQDLPKMVNKAYVNGQAIEEISRFRTIVAFHDNRNTERCTRKLKELRLI